MNFAAVFIRRPVLATMVVAFLVVLGLFSYKSLGVDLFPNVDLPVVTITTVLRGASPEEMEAQVTKPIEDAVNTASGIDELRSTTTEGLSIVNVTFVLERKTSEAVQDVRDKVAGILSRLPQGVEPPVITRFDTDAIPVATIVVSGSLSLKEITELADKRIKDELQVVNGVGQAALVGGQKRAVNVWLDSARLRSRHLSVQQVKDALAAQNVEIPTGRVSRETSEQVFRTMARIEEVGDFKDLIVGTSNGAPITLGDVGRAEDGIEEARSLSRYDGRNAVALVIQKQSGTNSVEVVDRIKGKVAAMKALLPPGVKVEVVRDISGFIRRSIDEVKLHLVLGGVLASIVVLLFMGNLRSTLIAAVAIPTSLIATFTAMRYLGFTLNNMTLLGLVLAVGIVIDDAIVVLENIYRHIDELKKPPLQAAIDGTKEIMLAVMATTLSLIVIFLPIAFMAGRVGRFFNSFGITVAISIAFSLVIAVTFTPMLCARFLQPHKHPHAQDDLEGGTWINRVIHKAYGRMVRFSLAHKTLIIGISLACVLATIPIFKLVGKDFIPLDDRSEFNISVQTPPGSTLDRSDEVMRRLEARVKALPHVEHLLTTIGDTGNGNADVTLATLYVGLKGLDDRKDGITQFEVMKRARKILAEFPELRASVQPISDIGGGGAGSYQFNYAIQGPELEKLDEIAGGIMAKMRTVPGLVDVDTATAQRKPELRVTIDRRKAADLGVRAADIANSLRTLVAGERVSKFREGAEQYDVWLRLRPEDRSDEAGLFQLEIPSVKGGLVPLSNLVHLNDDAGPAQIDRINRQRQVTLVANLDNLPLGTAVDRTAQFVKEADLPPGYRTLVLGRAKTFTETGVNFAIAFLLSLIFMYIILAAQFESFLHPVTILLSLPLTIPFALLSLLFLRETLNLYSVIGLFMLFGIVKKNGILQVDYTNTLRLQGMPLEEAVYKANLVRLRPILMTTVTLIAGMIPIALGKGPGASSRASMAKVIIGGQALSLIITLLIVPVAYVLFDDATVFFSRRFPEGLKARTNWALLMAGGAGALGLWLLLMINKLMAGLPGWLGTVAGLLALGGLAAFGLGCWVYRRSTALPEEAAG
ncbi:MAG: efflux RND transporter permease subunit [Holophagaceae bacterium]|nr:efflux RND transporter permease subunit [Holophagaceae bacterium]